MHLSFSSDPFSWFKWRFSFLAEGATLVFQCFKNQLHFFFSFFFLLLSALSWMSFKGTASGFCSSCPSSSLWCTLVTWVCVMKPLKLSSDAPDLQSVVHLRFCSLQHYGEAQRKTSHPQHSNKPLPLSFYSATGQMCAAVGCFFILFYFNMNGLTALVKTIIHVKRMPLSKTAHCGW